MKYIIWVEQPDEGLADFMYEGRSVFVSSDINEINQRKADYEQYYTDATYTVMCITPMHQEGP